MPSIAAPLMTTGAAPAAACTAIVSIPCSSFCNKKSARGCPDGPAPRAYRFLSLLLSLPRGGERQKKGPKGMFNTLRPKDINRQGSLEPPPPEIRVTITHCFVLHPFVLQFILQFVPHAAHPETFP
jgi:hypothetical protein